MLKFRIFGSSVRSTGSVPSADSQSGVAFVGRQLAKALSSELKSIRSNFLALFGFGPPSEIEEHVLRLSEEQKTELTANSDLAGKGGAAVESELRQLMAQMKELDKHNQVLQDAQNNRAQMSALLNKVREKELDKHNQVFQDALNNRAQMSALLNKVRECLKKELNGLKGENTPDPDTVAFYDLLGMDVPTQHPAQLSAEDQDKISVLEGQIQEIDDVIKDETHRHFILKAKRLIKSVKDEIVAENLRVRPTKKELDTREEPRIQVANKMVGLLTAAAEKGIELADHLNPDEVRYLNQSMGVAEKSPALWHGVKATPVSRRQGERKPERDGNYVKGAFRPHRQLANQMATLLKPNHQQSLLDRFEQVRAHLAGSLHDVEAAWSALSRIDERAVEHFFRSPQDQKALSDVLRPLKQEISAPSSSKGSRLLTAMSKKLVSLETALGIQGETIQPESTTASAPSPLSAQSSEQYQPWFYHDFSFQGLNAAFFEESFRQAMSFSPEHPEQFLSHLDHAHHEISAIQVKPENLSPPEREKLKSMLSTLKTYVQDQMNAFNAAKSRALGPEKEGHAEKLTSIQRQLDELVVHLNNNTPTV